MDDKEKYVQKLHAQLDELSASVDKMRAKMKEAQADAEAEMKKHVEAADARLKEGRQHLKELREAQTAKWEETKKRAEASWGALTAGVHDAIEKLRAKGGDATGDPPSGA
ncbi:MAG: coiled coil domain-containing protein [Sandaracinaceae bacterium]